MSRQRKAEKMSSDMYTNKPGTIGWIDLTVEDADGLRDFYASVAGWTPEDVSMGDYSDYVMKAQGIDRGVAGICHARGPNSDLPPQWLIYITVEDIDLSISNCLAGGGKVISGPKNHGDQWRYCVIRDPAGAAVALIGPAAAG